MYKAFRKKDIKVHGVRVKQNLILCEGDVVEIYIIDDILDGVPNDDYARRDETSKVGTKRKSMRGLSSNFDVVYEDSNIIIVNKAQGIPVHPDRDTKQDTLIDLVRKYLDSSRSHSNPTPVSGNSSSG